MRGGGVGGGGISRWEDGMSKFSAGGGTPPILPSRENLLDVNKDSGTK